MLSITARRDFIAPRSSQAKFACTQEESKSFTSLQGLILLANHHLDFVFFSTTTTWLVLSPTTTSDQWVVWRRRQFTLRPKAQLCPNRRAPDAIFNWWHAFLVPTNTQLLETASEQRPSSPAQARNPTTRTEAVVHPKGIIKDVFILVEYRVLAVHRIRVWYQWFAETSAFGGTHQRRKMHVRRDAKANLHC